MSECAYPGCGEPIVSYCEAGGSDCDRPFCEDHGTVGGDRLRGEVLMAYPSACWLHGGFNATPEGIEEPDHVGEIESWITRAEALAMKARARKATVPVPFGSTETRRLMREKADLMELSVRDVPALVEALEEAMHLVEMGLTGWQTAELQAAEKLVAEYGKGGA